MINAIGIFIGTDLTDEGITPPTGNAILMESSGYVLMEDGSHILTE